jgi:hypothetical protein
VRAALDPEHDADDHENKREHEAIHHGSWPVPDLGSCPRGTDAASGLLADLTQSAGLHVEPAGSLEGVLHCCPYRP